MELRSMDGMATRVSVIDRGFALFMSFLMVLGMLMTFVPERVSATEEQVVAWSRSTWSS